MTEPMAVHGAPPASASTPVFLATFGVVLAATAALLVLDLWLARIDARESHLHAMHLFEDGRGFLAERQSKEAVDRFASAQALERGNVRYGVALAEALLADGRADEAEAQLRGVLRRAETDGPANLVMGRILARQRKLDDAAAYYHRAIYGSWSADSSGQPLHARLELIDLLVRRGARRAVLAELLPLQEAAPDSVALRRRLGHLFILAGSPSRAIPLFRSLLRRDENDGDAYAGMGEAALLLGNFRTARADLTLATRLLPDSGRFASALEVADTVLALDPMARGIGHTARADRSRALLRLTVAAAAACAQSAALRAFTDSARIMLAAPPLDRRRGRADDADDADPILDLATDVWSRMEPRCREGSSPTRRALALIQEKLS